VVLKIRYGTGITDRIIKHDTPAKVLLKKAGSESACILSDSCPKLYPSGRDEVATVLGRLEPLHIRECRSDVLDPLSGVHIVVGDGEVVIANDAVGIEQSKFCRKNRLAGTECFSETAVVAKVCRTKFFASREQAVVFRVATPDEGSSANEETTSSTILAASTVSLNYLDCGLSRWHLSPLSDVSHSPANLCVQSVRL